MSERELFAQEVADNTKRLAAATDIQALSRTWIRETGPFKYSYNFSWLGRPIIQFPQDILAVQEIIWATRPDLIVETGVAHGGSLMLAASMLELCAGDGRAVGIDIDIRPHNRTEIEGHVLSKRIDLIEGSSTDDRVVARVRDLARGRRRVLVMLDSNHSHEHVAAELRLYSPLVGLGSYLIVFDTIIEDMPASYDYGDRPWGKGNNPKTAVHEFLQSNGRFEVDKEIEAKLLITVAPDGYLKCVKD